jgi:transglutaminase-like putative cysteine protease
VHRLVDADKADEPPSALAMLRHGGDCDGAAALVTATLRACGLPARPVVGYRLVDAGGARARLVPHALAEVYSTSGWMRVDATMPALGILDDVFVPVGEGLGGALSMGRLLGVLDGGDLVADVAAPNEPSAPAAPQGLR